MKAWHWLTFCLVLLLCGIAVSAFQVASKTIIDGTFQVENYDYESYEVSTDSSVVNARLVGYFDTTGGVANDIRVYIMDEYAFVNWKNGHTIQTIFDSGQVTTSYLNVPIAQGEFYVVFDNTFSSETKNSTANISLKYDQAVLGFSFISMYILGGSVFAMVVAMLNLLYMIKKGGERAIGEWGLLVIPILLIFGVSWFFNPSTITFFATLATLLVAMLTFLNIHLTKKTVDEMKATRISQTRPYMIVDFDIREGTQIIDLVIRNLGKGVAKEPKFAFDPPLQDSRGRILSEMPLFKGKLDFVPPDKEIRQIFDSALSYFGVTPELPTTFDVSISYFDEKKENEFKDSMKLDLSIYKGLTYIKEKNIGDVVKQLEKIASELRKFVQSIKKKK